MEYRIFGPGGSPSGNIRDQLSTFLKLDHAQRKTIAEVFLHDNVDLYGRTVPTAVAASSILPEQYRDAADLIRYLLSSWREYDLQIADIEGDLLLLGCTEHEIQTVSDFFKALAPIRDKVWAENYSRVQQLDGLPTMDNVNIICDARAVFGGFPDAYDGAGSSYKTFLRFTPIVIMEIISSDNYGREQRTAIQMNEQQFEGLRKVIARAQEQLDIMKERIGNSLGRA